MLRVDELANPVVLDVLGFLAIVGCFYVLISTGAC